MMQAAARRLWPYLRRYKRGLAAGFGALVLKDIAAAGLPLLIKSGIDSLTHGGSLHFLFKVCGLLVLLSAVKGLFQYWMRVILIGISRDIEYDLRNDFFAHLAGLSSDFYSRTRTGDIMARATNDLNAVRMMLGPGLMYWAETMLTFVLAVIIMLRVDWPLTLIALAPSPLVTLVVIRFGSVIHERFERIQGMFSDISSRVQENLSGVRVIRAYVQEEAELRQFETLNRQYIAENLSLARTSSMFMPLLQALIGITFLIVLWVGGYRLLSGHISLGSFVMFNTYMGMLVWPMIALGWVVNLMQRGTASLDRISQILDERPAIHAPSSPQRLPAPVHGAIEFRGVSVEYPAGLALEWDRPGDSRRERRSPSSATPAAERARWCGSSRGCSIPRRGACCWTASTYASSRRPRCGARSASCRRRRSCSARRSPKTSRWESKERPRQRSAARPTSRASVPISKGSRTATGPCWESAASRSPGARSSARPSPAPSFAIRGF